ncbi:MAG: hypothetical protein JRJ85_08085 [Deltaproteobacteria bacterium]|nr:hypothetical protein [Deltaproteobacteria bacterium]
MLDLKTNLDLKSIFDLIQKIKKGIKQKSCITITESDNYTVEPGLRILIETKNYKTKEYMYFKRNISESELIHTERDLHYTIIEKTIEEANDYFREEQTVGLCEECGKQLTNKEINEGITVCEKCATGLYGYEEEYNKGK